MEFLREMLNFQEQSPDMILAEELGNLNAIDKKFINALKRSYTAGKYDDKGNWKNFEKRFLSGRAGRSSTIEEKGIGSAKQVADEFETDASVIAIVIFDKKTDMQYGIVAEQNPKAYKQERTLKVMVDATAMAGANASKEQIDDVKRYFTDKVKISMFDSSNIGVLTTDFTSSKVYNAINHINKFVKSPNKDLAIKVVHADAERPAKKQERAKARSGVIPVKLDGKEKEDFIKQAKYSLQKRLDVYKSEKLKKQNKNISLDEFLDAVRKDGYLDKFLVNGYIYEYYRDSFNFGNMIKGRHKTAQWESDKSYVTYRVDDNAPEYEKVRREYWEQASELRDLSDDSEAYAHAKDKLKKRLKIPPTYIKVFFDFDGGAIVPAYIEIEDNNI